jgi:putative redox protein
MTTETVSVEWLGRQVFLLKDRHGFPIVMTQPGGVNGADLLPLSIIGCAVWDVAAILRKQRQKVSGLTVSAESLREDDPPWRFRKITIRYQIRGRGLDKNRIEQAVELSQKKYCSTYATLSAAVEIVSEVEVLEDEPEGSDG